MNTIEDKNPLLCDIETGLCGVSEPVGSDDGTKLSSPTKPIKIVYFTDPICSSCWGIEPQLRKLKLEYGGYFEIDYHMGGLLPSWDVYSSGLDTFQFKADYEGKANESFQEDLNFGKYLAVSSFPTLFFTDADNNQALVYGFRPYEAYEETIRKFVLDAQKNVYNRTPLGVFSSFNTLMTKEFAVLTGLDPERAEKTLHGLLDEGKINKFESKNGILWKK